MHIHTCTVDGCDKGRNTTPPGRVGDVIGSGMVLDILTPPPILGELLERGCVITAFG